MAQWSWHNFPNPHGYQEADGLVGVPVPGRGTQPYAWMRDWSEVDSNPALAWLRQNPHRFSLGRIGLALRSGTGQAARLEALAETRQRLDLWTGTLSSSFVYDTQPVSVTTQVHPVRDMVMVEIRSPLLKNGQLAIEISYPGVSSALEPDPSDWTHDESHHTTELRREPGHVLLQRQLDDTRYYSSILAPGARIERVAPHRFRISATGDRLSALVCFDRDEQTAWPPESEENAAQAVAASWRGFWQSGGAIDFSGSTDPRAPELERRIVLSQYLTAINCAGALPPQEEGLFANSWYGKFHLEMHPWHAAHFATWGRTALLERSLRWYLDYLPQARQAATLHKVTGAWWPKMVRARGTQQPEPHQSFHHVATAAPHLSRRAGLPQPARSRDSRPVCRGGRGNRTVTGELAELGRGPGSLCARPADHSCSRDLRPADHGRSGIRARVFPLGPADGAALARAAGLPGSPPGTG